MALLADIRAALGVSSPVASALERDLSASRALRLDFNKKVLVYRDPKGTEWSVHDVRRSNRKPRSAVPLCDPTAYAREFESLDFPKIDFADGHPIKRRLYYFRAGEDHVVGEEIIDRQFRESKSAR